MEIQGNIYRPACIMSSACVNSELHLHKTLLGQLIFKKNCTEIENTSGSEQ